MASLPKALTALAALAFAGAVVTNFIGPFFASAEGYSHAATNLALLAIALVVGGRSASLR